MANILIAVRHRLVNSTGFFVLFWAVHYFPFFLFSRQLFIHHYLPSHLISALIAGSVLSFALSETINYPVSVWGPRLRATKPSTYADLGMRGPIFVGVFSLILFIMFIYMAPLTYGTPGYVFLRGFRWRHRLMLELSGSTATRSTLIACSLAGRSTSPQRQPTQHKRHERALPPLAFTRVWNPRFRYLRLPFYTSLRCLYLLQKESTSLESDDTKRVFVALLVLV